MLLSFILLDLAWEVVKANLNESVRGEWPWRFTVLDTSTCAAVVALLTGLIVTRTQLSQTLRPVLSWSGFGGHSRELSHSLRTVTLINAGGGRSVVRSVTYRIRASAPFAEDVAIPTSWLTLSQAVDSLTTLGLSRGEDYFLLHLGSGAAIPMTSVGRDGMEVLALGAKAMERLAMLDIKVQVIDVLGDVHERQLQCIRPVPQPRHSTGP
ncbi:hypothetical protein [Streptomyces sp. NPDC127033]|uniref:hypothetical protein n=1 Tax=Streptomyces sp. NPDC127033 TaxID=3347110 RepID=UPI0036641EF3